MGNQQSAYDVIIIGAGLSGIAAAYHLQDKCPNMSYAVLEGRASMGGTWDLFKYPGIRSDSDMYTLGFSFNPWKDPKAIADGSDILQYIKDTARKFGIDEKIKFNHKVEKASWSTEDKHWSLNIVHSDDIEDSVIKCRFLFMCSGYYDYENGHSPPFAKRDAFQGEIIHPQKWDSGLDYNNKKVVIIGSGATAVTLVPEMAKKAEKVTMIQRSPTYIMNLPSEDMIANTLRKILPNQMAHQISRWKNILIGLSFYKISKRYPNKVKGFLQRKIERTLGTNYDSKHFDPKYNPWDQRLCLVPDNDLFDAINDGKVDIVTDTIKQFTKEGILLDSEREIAADIIVTATGLKIQLLGGMQVFVDNKPIDLGKLHLYRGVMFEEIPNFAIALGYTNASWTLKCDLNCYFVTKVLNYMMKNEYSSCVPKFDSDQIKTESMLDFTPNYIKRASKLMPKQGSKTPWKVHQNYVRDIFLLRYSSVEDGCLEFK